MKNLFKMFFLVTGVITLTFVNADAAVKTGQMAPNFSLADTFGNGHTLSNYKGKYIVLEWLNHDCPFVKKHYGSNNMQSLQKKYGEKGVVWFSVSSSAEGKQGHYKPNDANQLTAQKGAAPTAVLLDFDGKVGRTYGAKTTPHMFIIDPSGKLIYQGAIDSIASANPNDVGKAQNFVQKALDEAMSGKPISVGQTGSYGCSVKY